MDLVMELDEAFTGLDAINKPQRVKEILGYDV
jgi:hypothetical protein